MTTSARWILGGAVAAGLYGLYTQLDMLTQEKILGYVRGGVDKLPQVIKDLLPSSLLSDEAVAKKGVNKTVRTASRNLQFVS